MRNKSTISISFCNVPSTIFKNRYLDQGQEPIALDTVAYHARRL